VTGQVVVTLTGPLGASSATATLTEAAFGGRRARLAFVAVVLAGDRAISRDELAEIVWADGPPATWASALRVAMSKVRAALAELLPDAGDVLVHTPSGYRLEWPATTEVDVDVVTARASVAAARTAFEDGDAVAAIRSATEARVVLSRPFLPTEEGPWIVEIRDQLHAARLDALEVLARARIELDQPALAVAAAGEAVRLDPYREVAHRLLISAHVAGGNRGEALRAYERCRRVLGEELGVDPSPETEQLYRTLLGDEPATRPTLVVTPGDWRLVGRDEQLALLEGQLDAAAAGRGGVVLLSGAAGMGKTRLARELAARASARGAQVLWGTCREPEWMAPLGAIADFAPELANLAPGPATERLEHRLSGADEQVPPDERFALREDFRRAVLAAADDRPILLVVDDVQWADTGTLAALRHLTPSVARARVLVVLTQRVDDASGDDEAVSAALAAMSREPGLSRVGVKPLDVSAVAELVASVAPNAPPWVASELTHDTGGNPFFAQAMLTHLVESGTMAVLVSEERREGVLLGDVPVEVRDVVARRLAVLGNRCRDLLGAGSVFEGPFRLGDAAGAADLSDADALDALDEALAAGLLVDGDAADTYEFAHRIVRSTIASAVSSSRRARLHRRVADVIEQRAGARATVADARELAGQYHASASLPGAERGVAHAIRAAEHAKATGAFDTEAALLGIAVDLVSADDPGRDDLVARRGIALLCAGRFEEGGTLALAVADEAVAAGDIRGAAVLVAEAAWAAEMAGGSPVAFALSAAGMPLVADGPRDDVWARLTILDLRRREGDEPTDIGLPLDPPERREAARVLHGDPRYRGDLAWAVWENRGEILERGRDDMHALTFWAGRYREALPLWQRAATAAEARGQVSIAVNDWGGAARAAIALGHLADAASMIEHAEDLARRIDLRGSFALQLLAALDDLVHARDDGYEDLWAASRRLTSERQDRTQRWAEANWFASAARSFALEGRVDEARALLDAVVEVLPAVPAWIVSTNRVVGDTVAAMWLLDDARHLTVVEDAVRTKLVAPDFRCPMTEPRLAMGRIAGLGGRRAEAGEWFNAARAVCHEDGLGPLLAIVDHDEALLAARAGDSATAHRLADAAAERAATLGLGGWLRRAEALAAV
jgi:DNA-binding SARP family transcriptional activator